MRVPRLSLTLALALLAGAGRAAAQEACADGLPRAGTLGIGLLHCVGGSCAVNEADGRGGRAHRFSTEPRVWRLDGRGPAARVLNEGDVITAVDGALITTREGGRRLANLRAGVPVKLGVRRAGSDVEVRVVPVEGCNAPAVVVNQSPARPAWAVRFDEATVGLVVDEPPARLGMEVECGDCGWRRGEGGAWRWHSSQPVRVRAVEPGSPAHRAGVRPGDVLVRLGGEPLTTAGGPGLALAAVRPGEFLELRLERGGDTLAVDVAPPTMTARAASDEHRRARGPNSPSLD